MSQFYIPAQTLHDIAQATDKDRGSATLGSVCVRTDSDSLDVSLIATDGKILLMETVGTATECWPDYTITPAAMVEILGKGRRALKTNSSIMLDLQSGTVQHRRKGETYTASMTLANYPPIPTNYFTSAQTSLIRSSILAKVAEHCTVERRDKAVLAVPDTAGARLGRLRVDGGQVEAVIRSRAWPKPLAFNASYMATLAEWCGGVRCSIPDTTSMALVCQNGNRRGLVMCITQYSEKLPQPTVRIF